MIGKASYAFHVRRAVFGAGLALRAGAEPAPALQMGKVRPRSEAAGTGAQVPGMLDRGEGASMAALARLGRVTRARMTQGMD